MLYAIMDLLKGTYAHFLLCCSLKAKNQETHHAFNKLCYEIKHCLHCGLKDFFFKGIFAGSMKGK